MKDSIREVAETIYYLVNGQIDLETCEVSASKYVINEFQDGMPCAELYKKVYEAKLRLNERLHTSEDSDVETIIDSMDSIAHIVSIQMFLYGLQQEKFAKE